MQARPILARTTSHLKRAQAVETAQFMYNLPADRIAERPIQTRHDAKLLVVRRNQSLLQHASFTDLASLLPSEALIVRNVTRVIPARIEVRKSTGGRAEVFLLHPSDGNQAHDMLSAPTYNQTWNALIGGRKISEGDVLTTSSASSLSVPNRNDHIDDLVDTQQPVQLDIAVRSKSPSPPLVSLTSQPVLPLRSVLSRLGATPLPPYIRRPADASDRLSYQSVYAVQDGSVAAPTAGLHFTPHVLDQLHQKQIQMADIVLHVGLGTFRPISAPIVGSHQMHHEAISVSGKVVQQLIHHLKNRYPIVALGTTSMRTIESLYWFGARLLNNPTTTRENVLSVAQWEPYQQIDNVGRDSLPVPTDALNAVLDWCGGPAGHVHGGTNLLIVPGYRFMISNALITNFHQPGSTLLMLVSAFYGGSPNDLLSVYHTALNHDYRFLSYGDGSIYGDTDFFTK